MRKMADAAAPSLFPFPDPVRPFSVALRSTFPGLSALFPPPRICAFLAPRSLSSPAPLAPAARACIPRDAAPARGQTRGGTTRACLRRRTKGGAGFAHYFLLHFHLRCGRNREPAAHLLRRAFAAGRSAAHVRCTASGYLEVLHHRGLVDSDRSCGSSTPGSCSPCTPGGSHQSCSDGAGVGVPHQQNSKKKIRRAAGAGDSRGSCWQTGRGRGAFAPGTGTTAGGSTGRTPKPRNRAAPMPGKTAGSSLVLTKTMTPTVLPVVALPAGSEVSGACRYQTPAGARFRVARFALRRDWRTSLLLHLLGVLVVSGTFSGSCSVRDGGPLVGIPSHSSSRRW
mmetsp:Transcript_25924/g.65337  ORF Transcript_25924/g.65337 Transcript_25924/m.65337 type:complete len:339 (-) Transcript_25924:2581-3597(-)